MKKICMLGDPGVGKTSLIRRFVHDEFSDDYLSTIGTKVSEKELEIERGDGGQTYVLHLVIWDIAGQKTFTSVSPTLFRGAQAALVICDITRRRTLDNLNNWIYHLSENAGDIPFVILVNKWDLMDSKDFELTELERIVKGHGTTMMRTSAKTGHNVQEAFEFVGSCLVEEHEEGG